MRIFRDLRSLFPLYFMKTRTFVLFKREKDKSLKVSVRLTKTGKNYILLSITDAVKGASKVVSIFYLFFCMTCKNFWNGNYKGSDLIELLKKLKVNVCAKRCFTCSLTPLNHFCGYALKIH